MTDEEKIKLLSFIARGANIHQVNFGDGYYNNGVVNNYAPNFHANEGETASSAGETCYETEAQPLGMPPQENTSPRTLSDDELLIKKAVEAGVEDCSFRNKGMDWSLIRIGVEIATGINFVSDESFIKKMAYLGFKTPVQSTICRNYGKIKGNLTNGFTFTDNVDLTEITRRTNIVKAVVGAYYRLQKKNVQ